MRLRDPLVADHPERLLDASANLLWYIKRENRTCAVWPTAAVVLQKFVYRVVGCKKMAPKILAPGPDTEKWRRLEAGPMQFDRTTSDDLNYTFLLTTFTQASLHSDRLSSGLSLWIHPPPPIADCANVHLLQTDIHNLIYHALSSLYHGRVLLPK